MPCARKLEIAVGTKGRARVEIDLFAEWAPEACEHFRRMCDKTFASSYAGTSFHSLHPGRAYMSFYPVADTLTSTHYRQPMQPRCMPVILWGGAISGCTDGQFFGWGRSVIRKRHITHQQSPRTDVENRTVSLRKGKRTRICRIDSNPQWSWFYGNELATIIAPALTDSS